MIDEFIDGRNESISGDDEAILNEMQDQWKGQYKSFIRYAFQNCNDFSKFISFQNQRLSWYDMKPYPGNDGCDAFLVMSSAY